MRIGKHTQLFLCIPRFYIHGFHLQHIQNIQEKDNCISIELAQAFFSLMLVSQNTIKVLPYRIYVVLGLESSNYLTHMGRMCIGYMEIGLITSVESGHALNYQHSFLIYCEN